MRIKGFYLFSFIIIVIVVSVFSLASKSERQYEILYSNNKKVAATKQEENTYKFKIAIVPKRVNISYFKNVEEGAVEAANNLGMEIIYRGPQEADATLQNQIIEQLLEEDIDLLAVSAIDPLKIAPILDEAKNRNIKVITWDSDALDSSRLFFINMVEPETLGRHLMDTLAGAMNEEGDFAIITGDPASVNLSVWLNWIKVQNQQQYPNMNLVEVVPSYDDPIKAYKQAKQLINDYPNLKGIIGNSSVGPPAAAQAVREAGKTGEISVVGLSSPNEMRPYIKDGSSEMVTLWSPKKLGYLTVSIAKLLLEGNIPYDGQEIKNVGRIRVTGATIIMGEPIDFTKENVDQYDF